MKNRPSQTLPKLIWSAAAKASVLVVLAGVALFLYSMVQFYKNKHDHIQQLSSFLTSSAATADGATLVGQQVSMLLESEPAIKSIVFYSTTDPILSDEAKLDDEQMSHWQNALFADTVSFSHPVISTYATTRSSNTVAEGSADSEGALIGYINITLDINELRKDWLLSNLLFGIIVVLLGFIWKLFILRKLNWYAKDIVTLAHVCGTVIRKPELEQLPVIRPNYDFEELSQIKHAFDMLFERLRNIRQDYDDLADLKQQLHSKEVSLEVQRYNFQSMITHELTTSLNAIIGGLQLLDDNELDTEQKDTIAIIEKGAQQLALILDQIIQLNQIGKDQVSVVATPFNPLQVIADLIAEFTPIANQKNLVLSSQIHHIDYQLMGDVEKIKQILSILIGNAIKFTTVGEVVIKSQLTHCDNSNRWQIGVQDAGIGIAASHIDDIFNPFFQVDSSKTRQFEGSGLGLPLAKQLSQLIDATIDVKSKVNSGTEFTITMVMPSVKKSVKQLDLKGLKATYYYRREVGSVVNELRELGMSVSCQPVAPLLQSNDLEMQNSDESILDTLITEQTDLVVFAEDIHSDTAESLAKGIRERETEYRALIIYWYPEHQEEHLDYFEHGLKAAGVDYCQSATADSKSIVRLLKKWLA